MQALIVLETTLEHVVARLATAAERAGDPYTTSENAARCCGGVDKVCALPRSVQSQHLGVTMAS
ncbi:hypothetical protein [Pseudonocardia sp. MH-G8]|uniref:hypothetical protein n=1 Tax=Pseudonocardia sp. MH-G8 TaxID=1854588 RepID=UPI000B9FE24C|nr:hypothetical protein [Pseudonocardia sp. MH-G8]OZM79939.1 hypothetical protein CFP66_23340 [Pseudonocardia sp. MH-G8]